MPKLCASKKNALLLLFLCIAFISRATSALRLRATGANGRFHRALQQDQGGCTPIASTTDQCAADAGPHPACTPWRSIEYCDPDVSFGTLIQRRTTYYRNQPEKTSEAGYWFQELEDKSAAAIFSNENGLPSPEIYACLDMSDTDPFDQELLAKLDAMQGFVIKATSLHSSQSVYVLSSGFDGPELISGATTMSKETIVAELRASGILEVHVEEYISGAEENTLPTEYKFHMFPNPVPGGEPIVGGISVVYNRGAINGEECGCWAEVDPTWNRLDQYGCFAPGAGTVGGMSDDGQCTKIDSNRRRYSAGLLKGFDICGPIQDKPADCLLDDLTALAKQASALLGVYARIDLFASGVNNRVYVQEYTSNHMNGVRHCMAKSEQVSDTMSCVDPCYLGAMWQGAGDNPIFGGNGAAIDAELLAKMTNSGNKCFSAASTTSTSPTMSSCDIKTAPPQPPDSSGACSVFLSSNTKTVAISAPSAAGTSTSVYHFDGTSWNQLGTHLEPLVPNDQSGRPMSLSSDGRTVAIGTPYDKRSPVRVYKFDGTSWNQVGQELEALVDGDYFGQSVSLSSDGLAMAVGAFYHNGDATDHSVVRLYKYNGAQWIQVGEELKGEGANFNGISWEQLGIQSKGGIFRGTPGNSVSLSPDGTTVAIDGALGKDGTGSDTGPVRVYNLNGTDWNQIGMDLDCAAVPDDDKGGGDDSKGDWCVY